MNIPRFLTAFAALVLTAAVVRADDGFVDIFNGKNLQGWVVEGGKSSRQGDREVPIWSVKNGLLTATGAKYGFLRYDRVYKDFIAHAEYRLSKNCNSGFGIRTVKFTGKIDTAPSHAAYEVQVLADSGKKPTEHSSGSLYRYVAPKVNATRPAGQWNIIDIECRGPKIHIVLNGQVIQDVDQSTIDEIKDKPLSGYFCLQSHTNKIEFRKVQIKELKFHDLSWLPPPRLDCESPGGTEANSQGRKPLGRECARDLVALKGRK